MNFGHLTHVVNYKMMKALLMTNVLVTFLSCKQSQTPHIYIPVCEFKDLYMIAEH
mgnify:FL=1